jgi:hypothetical protein
MNKLLPLLGLTAIALIVSSTPAHAFLDLPILGGGGGGGGAPEIDPSSIGSAIALVMGGAAMLSNRFRR